MTNKEINWAVCGDPCRAEDTLLVLWTYIEPPYDQVKDRIYYGLDDYDYADDDEQQEGMLMWHYNFVDDINSKMEKRNTELGTNLYPYIDKDNVKIVAWARLPQMPEEVLTPKQELINAKGELKNTEYSCKMLELSTDYFTSEQHERFSSYCDKIRELKTKIKELEGC